MVALLPEDLTWRHDRGAVDVFGVQEMLHCTTVTHESLERRGGSGHD